jgi:hypothetical protein
VHHQPTRPTTWRAVPTLLLVIGALVLGALTARADKSPSPQSAPAAHSAQR